MQQDKRIRAFAIAALALAVALPALAAQSLKIDRAIASLKTIVDLFNERLGTAADDAPGRAKRTFSQRHARLQEPPLRAEVKVGMLKLNPRNQLEIR